MSLITPVIAALSKNFTCHDNEDVTLLPEPRVVAGHLKQPEKSGQIFIRMRMPNIVAPEVQVIFYGGTAKTWLLRTSLAVMLSKV